MKTLWQAADENIPADVRELAERWKMSETLLEFWRGAFIEGARYANRNVTLEQRTVPLTVTFSSETINGYRAG